MASQTSAYSECQIPNHQMSIALNALVREKIFEITDHNSVVYLSSDCEVGDLDTLGKCSVEVVKNRPTEHSKPYLLINTKATNKARASFLTFKAYQYGEYCYGEMEFIIEHDNLSFKRINYISAIQ